MTLINFTEQLDGYLECDLGAVIMRRNASELTRALYEHKYSYLMGRAWSEGSSFVHFTTKDRAESIIKNGYDLSMSDDYSDISNVAFCFRIDAMSRGFLIDGYDTALLFSYTGPYLSCIRQEDCNSNIGYQAIRNVEYMRRLNAMPIPDFYAMKSIEYMNYESILIHHGISPDCAEEIEGCDFAELSMKLPVMFEREAKGRRVDITQMFK